MYMYNKAYLLSLKVGWIMVLLHTSCLITYMYNKAYLLSLKVGWIMVLAHIFANNGGQHGVEIESALLSVN